jgi:TolB-like protein
MKKSIWFWSVFFLGIGVLEITAAQEKAIILDKAIQGAQAEIEANLAPGTKVVVINFTAPTTPLSDYVIDRLIAGLVNNRKMTVVERKDIGLIDTEMAYQFSGEVSDESAQAIGQKLGAQSIVSGKFEALGDQYHFSIKTIHVESATIELFYQAPIKQDKKLDTLLNITRQQTVKTQKEEDRKKVTEQNAQYRQVVQRKTRLILGVRGGIGGIASMGTQAEEGLPGTNSKPLFPEQVYSVYFGTSSLNSLTGFQVEGNFHLNTGMEVKDNNGKTGKFSYTAVDIPVLFRLGVAGGGLFSLFGGPYVSFPLSKMRFKYDAGGKTTEYEIATLLNIIGSYGILGGISMGFKLGPGYLALDGRYTFDFNPITVREDDEEYSLFRRRGFKVSLGYELWL